MFRLLSRHLSRRAADGLDEMPLAGAAERRIRGRRGGPRTPLPLLPLIAIAAGVALAYVNQTAHATQATYEATSLSTDQTQLKQESARLGDELGRLSSAERVVTAAQAMGMRPAGSWAYVVTQPVRVVSPPSSGAVVANDQSGTAGQQLVGDVSGVFGGAH